MALWKNYYDEAGTQRVLQFMWDNAVAIRLGQGIIRIGCGFILQNLAILYNIRRWSMIIYSSNKQISARIESQSPNAQGNSIQADHMLRKDSTIFKLQYAGSSQELSEQQAQRKVGQKSFENEYRKNRRNFKNIAKCVTLGNVLMVLWFVMDIPYNSLAIFLF